MGRKKKRDNVRAMIAQMLTVLVIGVLLASCLLGGLLFESLTAHRHSDRSKPVNVNQNVRVQVTCPGQGIPTVIGNG